VSHALPYCALDFPLDRLSSDWPSLFPAEVLASSAFERVEWEGLLEELWDGLQLNRALFEEHAPRQAAAAAAKTASSSVAASAAAGGDALSSSLGVDGREEQGESVLAHAMENYGFLPDGRIRAAMMGPASLSPSAPAATATATTTTTSERFYEFDEADSPSNIVMDDSGGGAVGFLPETGGGGGGGGQTGGASVSRNIKCATLCKLIERVTHEQFVDLNTRYVFLLTYHSFTTPSELLRLLSSRFHVPLPANLTPEELAHFKTAKLDRIQIRVCATLKNWIEEHWAADFANETQLKAQLQTLIQSMRDSGGSVLTRQLAKALEALLRKKERYTPATNTGPTAAAAAAVAALGGRGAAAASAASPSASSSSSSSGMGSSGSGGGPPKLLVSSKLTLESLFDLSFLSSELNVVELARQLTLSDFAKFRSIAPRECLNQNWSRAPAVRAVLAPNILALISQFNAVSLWVSSVIVAEKELKRRTRAMSKVLKLAEACRSLNNFHSCFAIYCGLSSNAIHRLKRTKAGLSSKAAARLASFADLFRGDKNSRNFRRTLSQSLTPCIPHLGIFLSDLTFTEDGNPDYLTGPPTLSQPSGSQMINFQKRCKLAERIRFIKQYQQEGYNLQSAPVLQAYLAKALSSGNGLDAEQLWKKSKEVEPKETQ
jgi:hypothetical protein